MWRTKMSLVKTAIKFAVKTPKVEEFERSLEKYTGAKHAVAVSNGTAALHCACLAIGLKEGDEVITTPITFAASANCALYCAGVLFSFFPVSL